MYRPCFQELTIGTYKYYGVHSLLSAFFLSPYPVTLKLDLRLDSNGPIPVPSLAINTEQQSKSLDVDLYVHRKFFLPCILESNFFLSTLY